MRAAKFNFEDIYNAYSHGVYRVCMGYVNDPAQAKDLMQEIFISIWKNLPSFREEARLTTWIFRIATNVCLRAVANNKKTRFLPLPIDFPETQEQTLEAGVSFLYRCIAQLEETERIIISLVLEDLPQADIAEIVGVSHANVRVKIHRIKEKLSAQFRQHGKFE